MAWDEPPSVRDGSDRGEDRRKAGRRPGLLLGLGLALAGTVLNKVLGHELMGRVLVILGALLALAAHARPDLLGILGRSGRNKSR